MNLDLELQFEVRVILGRAQEGIWAVLRRGTVDRIAVDSVDSPSVFLLPAVEVFTIEEGFPAFARGTSAAGFSFRTTTFCFCLSESWALSGTVELENQAVEKHRVRVRQRWIWIMGKAYRSSEPMGSVERGNTEQGRGVIKLTILFYPVCRYSATQAPDGQRAQENFQWFSSVFLCFSRWRGFYDPCIISVIAVISAGWVSSDTFATDAALGLGSLDGAGNPTERLELDLAYFCY